MKYNIQQKSSAKRLAMLGIATAILIIQTYVPMLGNLPIPPLNPTIIHITVIVFTCLLGTKDGIIVGGIWGIIRLLRAFTLPASPLDPLLWINPIITILPRALVGLTTGLCYRYFSQKWGSGMSLRVAAFIGSMTNTVFVLLFIYLFMTEDIAMLMKLQVDRVVPGLMMIVVTSGIPEAIASTVFAPVIIKSLKRVY